MAADINSCTFSGNVTKDPVAHGYGEGKQLARFTIAANQFGDRPPAYVDLTAFNGLAEKVVLPHVKRGSQVFVHARYETRVVDDRGENRTKGGFVVLDLRLGGSPNGGQGNGGGSAPTEEPPPF